LLSKVERHPLRFERGLNSVLSADVVEAPEVTAAGAPMRCWTNIFATDE
jgi:hypothetical protein